MSRAPLFVLVALAAVGCWDATYHCTRDDECVLDGTTGRCEPTGVCSLPSMSCPSGYVFAPHSPMAGSCVAGEAVDGGGDAAEAPTCGNGMLDPDEKCDPAIIPPDAGVCPTADDCDDHNPCTSDSVEGSADDCSARCTHAFITSCGPADGCCPTGCTPVSDSDCSATCGNGTVDGAESCDKAIAPGQAGACPTSCPPQNGCTSYMLIGDASVCTAKCLTVVTTTCSGTLAGDGCCPPGCNVLNDGDCV
jgi:hypothetical protein